MKTVFRIALYSSYSFFTTAYAQEHSVAALRAERVSEVSRLLNDFKVTSSQDAKRITPEFREAHVAHIKTLFVMTGCLSKWTPDVPRFCLPNRTETLRLL
jgi:hypothetical protein